MSTVLPLSFGRFLLLAANSFIPLCAFLTDWSESRVGNSWPPHARFHNGQTMSFNILLSALATYLLLRGKGRVHRTSRNLEDSYIAALVGSLYSIAGLFAITYPVTAWKDLKFDGPEGVEIIIFGGQLALNWLGYALEHSRLSHLKVG